MPLSIITLVFLVLSLNARGMVDPTHKIIHVEWLSSMAEPDGVFDASTNYAFIPILLHTIVLNFLD